MVITLNLSFFPSKEIYPNFALFLTHLLLIFFFILFKTKYLFALICFFAVYPIVDSYLHRVYEKKNTFVIINLSEIKLRMTHFSLQGNKLTFKEIINVADLFNNNLKRKL